MNQILAASGDAGPSVKSIDEIKLFDDGELEAMFRDLPASDILADGRELRTDGETTDAKNAADLAAILEQHLTRSAQELISAQQSLGAVRALSRQADADRLELQSSRAELERMAAELQAANDALKQTAVELETRSSEFVAATEQVDRLMKEVSAAGDSEQKLREELARLEGELNSSKAAHAAMEERVELLGDLCRREHVARKQAAATVDEMAPLLKRSRAGEAVALRRVAELSRRNDELEIQLYQMQPQAVPSMPTAAPSDELWSPLNLPIANDLQWTRKAG